MLNTGSINFAFCSGHQHVLLKLLHVPPQISSIHCSCWCVCVCVCVFIGMCPKSFLSFSECDHVLDDTWAGLPFFIYYHYILYYIIYLLLSYNFRGSQILVLKLFKKGINCPVDKWSLVYLKYEFVSSSCGIMCQLSSPHSEFVRRLGKQGCSQREDVQHK